MTTPGRPAAAMLILLFAYAAASLLHHVHNAEFLAEYPNMPAWLSRGKVYLAWLGVTALGVVGYALLRQGRHLIGLALIALYAGLGFYGLGHYGLAPFAAHTATMNLTIWLEAATAALLLLAVGASMAKQLRQGKRLAEMRWGPALRALIAFLLLPGVAAFIAPPLLASVDPWRGNVLWPGVPLMLVGSVLLLWCVRDFYVSGKGTLAPWDPPKSLVVVGLYRHVRNPMYVGVLTLVAGWSVLLASPVVGLYTAVLAMAFHLRVLLNEEPWLSSRFAADWTRYSAGVHRWLPRLKPWNGAGR